MKPAKKQDRMVVKSNVLIDSRYKLSLSEMKLALLIISSIKRSDKDFRTYKIYVRDFIQLVESKRSGMYSEARAITKSLMSKVLEIPTEYGHLQVAFLSSAKHFRGKGYLEIKFDSELKPYLLELKSKYTTYDIGNILPCRSMYSIRLYELLKSFEGLGKRRVSVDDLRHMLDADNIYIRFYDFKKRVIEPARKELKKYSDVYFEYETEKHGRYITHISFKILKKQQKRFAFDADNQVIDYGPAEVSDSYKTLKDEWEKKTKKPRKKARKTRPQKK